MVLSMIVLMGRALAQLFPFQFSIFSPPACMARHIYLLLRTFVFHLWSDFGFLAEFFSLSLVDSL